MTSKEERKLQLLTTQREYVFRAMQIMYDLSGQMAQDSSKISKFRARYTRIETLRQEFVEINDQINALLLIQYPDKEIDLQQLVAFDDLYFEVVSAASALTTTSSASTNVSNAANSSGVDIVKARLPKLELPKFDSNIENWQTFYDSFVTLIHENNSIAPIEKFHYLISCLSGSALAIAKEVPLTSSNYQSVFDALVERFQNKRVLADTYLEKMYNFPQIKHSNVQELQKYTNTLFESVNALRALNIENLGDFILFHLAFRALDADTRKRFEIQNESSIPTYQALLKFLQGYVKVLETTYHSCNVPSSSFRSNQTPSGRNKQSEPRHRSSVQNRSFLTTQGSSSSQSTSLECVYCGSAHSIYKCPTFKALDYNSKLALVDKKKLCTNCLRSNHHTNKCISKAGCFTCGLRHHTYLHPRLEPPQASNDTAVTHAGTSAHIDRSRATSLVLLGTCIVRVRDAYGALHPVRALIDSGAQDCFMTTACAHKLGFQLHRCNLTVAGLGQNTVCRVNGKTQLTIQPLDEVEPLFNITAIVIDTITSKMPTTPISVDVREHYKHLTLADRDFDKPSDIDLLLGAELFDSIYDGQRVKPGPGLPAALHSVFGWVLTGPLQVDSQQLQAANSSLLASTSFIDEVVKRFWQVEEPPKARISVPEDDECERLYTNLTYREHNGRYVVPLLLKHPHGVLGDSFNSSLSRLWNLEKRLSRQSQLKSEYINFMREYQNLGHMQPISKFQQGKNIIPHHAVVRSQGGLRVVFDGGCVTSNGLSLNDIVYTGPKLQADIIDIITGFRLHVVVFTCDIAKMYRQFLIRPEDRAFQHILWRESPSDSVTEYELNTVTYGVSSSPYLAIRTLHQLAQDHGDQWPKAADVLRHDTFVDDVTTGAPSLNEALDLKNDLINLLNCAQLQFRKWSSTCPQFLAQLPAEHCQTPKSFSEDGSGNALKILGVRWDPKSDYFTYSFVKFNVEYTKRSILSNVSRIFDPLGWLTPFILRAKLLLQDLWRLQLSWDEQIPTNVADDWCKFVSELDNLKSIKIQRHIAPSDAIDFQLIGFCDGSTKAFGCCVYLRSVTKDQIQINLLIAKSKVAPLKPLTVNRLELCSAVLLSRVLKHIHSLLSKKLNISQIYAFTDSSTVLSWLNTEPHKLKTFVAHRVVQVIDTIHPSKWHHVSTHDNPADYSSRGLSCSQLAECNQWWLGPEWLIADPSNWSVPFKVNSAEIPEMKSTSHLSCTQYKTGMVDVLSTFIQKFSSLTRLQRTLAWCLRFINNAKRAVSDRTLGSLTLFELEHSLEILIKYVQETSFEESIQQLKSNKPLIKHLQKLSPFLDSSGFLRVGGRLTHATLPKHAKHPYLLPKQSPLSNLIIDHFHVTYMHCGPRTLQSLIQRRFWILGIRNLIRSRLSKCVTCFKVNPTYCKPKMGDLPASRLESGRCFQNVGIDFGGPFTVKESRRRNARTYKAYVCLIVCLSVKAVHLELVTELSTEAFIAALDRFVSRRGICKSIVTDCGTNFVGAQRYLSEISDMLVTRNNDISDRLSFRGITWKFNPPSAPHFGGIFESGIKSTKYHLKRVIGSQVLTFEELCTVLIKVEAMLNSRPLCELSSDPGEVDVLTAGHFLIGCPLVSVPEPTFDENITLRSHWQLLQRLSQSFWRSWQRDYLRTLQQKAKWYRDGNRKPAVGDLVTVMEPNLPPHEWRLGRIIQVHPGADNITRVVTLKTAKGRLVRPIVKICPLPLN